MSGKHENMVSQEENLCLIKTRLLYWILHEYTGLAVMSGNQNSASRSLISKMIFVLVRLEIFKTSAVASLQENGRDASKGFGKRCTMTPFVAYLPDISQKIGVQICSFVRN